MSKRVYVAGPWVDREVTKLLADKVEALGHTITHKWWKYEGESQNDETKEFLLQCAVDDVQGVATADVVLVNNTAKSEGKAVEQGMAIVLGIPILCITPGDVKPSSNIFHYLPCYRHFKTVDEAMEALSE